MEGIDPRRTVEIDGWKLGIRFSSSHLLAHHNKCSRLHGHTYVVKLKVKGAVNDQWMVVDFGELKETLREIISEMDHRLLLPGGSTTMNIELGVDYVEVENEGRFYRIPKEDVLILPVEATTAESLSAYILKRLLQRYPALMDMDEVALGLDEGWGQGAWSVWRGGQ